MVHAQRSCDQYIYQNGLRIYILKTFWGTPVLCQPENGKNGDGNSNGSYNPYDPKNNENNHSNGNKFVVGFSNFSIWANH